MNIAAYQELLLFLLLAVIIMLALGLRRRLPPEKAIYQAQPALFTPAERFFLSILLQALDSRAVMVFGKVRLADVIMPNPKLAPGERQAAFNRICAKHVDFVLCHRTNLSIIGIIELDDLSHQRPDRQARDKFVDSALAAAKIPILHVKVRRSYSVNALKIEMERLFKLSEIKL
jgi:hypothetical protein